MQRKCFTSVPAGRAVGVNLPVAVALPKSEIQPEIKKEIQPEIKPQKQEIVVVEEPKAKSTTVAKVKTPADINSVLLQMSGLVAEANESTGDPTYCESCNGALNQYR